MQQEYPKYYRSENGEEQIKLFNSREQAYIRAVKFKNGFDYCAYRNKLEDGEEKRIKHNYIPSTEEEYYILMNQVIAFFLKMKAE